MTKITATALCLLAFYGAANAQTCADIKLKKGQVLTYNREMVPMQTKDVAYFKMSKKEKDKADEDYVKAVAEGKIAKVTDQLVSTVEDVTTEGDVTKFSMSTTSKGVPYKTKAFCSNSIFVIAPYQDYQQTSIPAGNQTLTYTSINGYNKIPLSIKVGDTIPMYQNVSYMSPLMKDYPVKVRHTEKDMNGDLWLITETKMEHVEVSSSTVTKYVNRQVIGEEEIMISGTPYKAYKISSEVWTRVRMKGDASSISTDALFNAALNLIDKKTQKRVGANPEGYLVFAINDWFVPQLGAMAKTEIYDTNGNLTTTLTLNNIQ